MVCLFCCNAELDEVDIIYLYVIFIFLLLMLHVIVGLLLSLGGFLSFMVTGSISAIRFGVILGGTLLALSVSSLRSQNRGEISPLALKGQAGQCMVC